MHVIRTMPDKGWVPISNDAARNHKLSWRARGLLTELLSYPDGWETSVDKLVSEARRQGEASEGRAAMRKAVAELADAGYVTYVRTRDDAGRWVTDMFVCDDPTYDVASRAREGEDRRTRNRTVGGPDRRGSETSENQPSEDWHVLKNTDTNTETNTGFEERLEHSTSLTSFAAAAGAATTQMPEWPTIDDAFKAVNDAPAERRKRALLALERRRAKIYRECRRHALAQIKKETPGVFNSEDGARAVDRLSLQYAVLHYYPDVPLWIARHIAPLEAA